ncbi:flagellin [Cereibacter sediminicola]|uniref:flagellin n=1 Tax=Cereibacter sediminicola TaxID=2584941 RepID=UPI0011A49E85|nr:flagellin [Cereibacter sediminicola]
MSAVSLGDLARNFMLRRQNVALKTDAQRLSTEVITGLAADTRRKVGGDLAVLNRMDSSLALLAARSSITAETAMTASAMQTALAQMDGVASGLSLDLLSLTPGGSSMTIDQLGEQAEEAFRSAVSALNTQVGDRSIFGGTRPQAAAVMDADALLGLLETVAAGATSAADVQAAIGNWFDSPAGYATLAYGGGDVLAPVTVGSGEKVTLDVTANDPALRETLKGLAMAAMLNRGALAGASADRAELAQIAGNVLLQGQGERVDLAARLGRTEARIEQAASAAAAEATALKIARKDLLGIDEYEAASLLQATQSQLETLYSLTARLSRLSLTDYL